MSITTQAGFWIQKDKKFTFRHIGNYTSLDLGNPIIGSLRQPVKYCSIGINE